MHTGRRLRKHLVCLLLLLTHRHGNGMSANMGEQRCVCLYSHNCIGFFFLCVCVYDKGPCERKVSKDLCFEAGDCLLFFSSCESLQSFSFSRLSLSVSRFFCVSFCDIYVVPFVYFFSLLTSFLRQATFFFFCLLSPRLW